MFLCEKQAYIPVTVGMRRFKSNGKSNSEYLKPGKTSQSYNFNKTKNSSSTYRTNSTQKQHESSKGRRKSLDTQETWTLINGNRTLTNGDLFGNLSRKKDGRVFPQIKQHSRSKSSNNLLELVTGDKHTYSNSGFLTERRPSNNSYLRRHSLTTPRDLKKQRSISVDSRPVTSYNNISNVRSTSSQKSGQSISGSAKVKLNTFLNDSRPQSRDSQNVGDIRQKTSEATVTRNNSNKSLTGVSWPHNIRDESKSPVPLNIPARPIHNLTQLEPSALLMLKQRSSSVRSPSSNDSLSGASFSMKYAGRRRLSLPAPSGSLLLPISAEFTKSLEYAKTFQDLHSKNVSDLRENIRLQTSSPNNRKDSLQIIQEIPTESQQLKQVVAVFPEETALSKVQEVAKEKIQTKTINNEEVCTNGALRYEETAENYPHLRESSIDVNNNKKSLFYFDAEDIKRRNSSHLKKEEEISNREKNISMVHGISEDFSDDSINDEPPQWNLHNNQHFFSLDDALNLATERFKENVDWDRIDFESDSSVVDLSVVNQENESLDDYLFRKKRIILWLMSAETDDKAESNVSSRIVSVSPPSGTKATAINVVYGE